MKIKKTHLISLAVCLILSGCATVSKTGPETPGSQNGFRRTMESTTLTEEGAIVERFTLYSPSMDREIRVAVVLPPAYEEDPDREFPILYTLHGANAPYDTYANMPKLRAELKDKPFIYTCFDADGVSRYIDAYYPVVTARRGDPDQTKRLSLFTTFFFEEFMPAIDGWYRVDTSRRGVTGFSMGGAGAFHYMLERPEQFTAVSGLSSAFYRAKIEGRPDQIRRFHSMLGDPNEFPERYQALDYFYRMKKHLSEGKSLPPLYLNCGTEDRYLSLNREMHELLEDYDVDLEYIESPGGHNWDFWYPASVGIAEFHWKHFNESGDSSNAEAQGTGENQ